MLWQQIGQYFLPKIRPKNQWQKAAGKWYENSPHRWNLRFRSASLGRQASLVATAVEWGVLPVCCLSTAPARCAKCPWSDCAHLVRMTTDSRQKLGLWHCISKKKSNAFTQFIRSIFWSSRDNYSCRKREVSADNSILIWSSTDTISLFERITF